MPKTTADRSSTIKEAADALDISVPTIRRDVQNRGAPHGIGPYNKLLFSIPEYKHWREAQKLTGQQGVKRADVDKPVELKDAKLRKEIAQAEKLELANAITHERFVPIEDVKRDWATAITTAKNKFIGMAATIVPQLQGMEPAEQQIIIERRVVEILNELAK